MGDYEGYAKYADDTVVSLQCYGERHGACPQEPDDDDGEPQGPPLFGGYYCECSCGHDQPEVEATAGDYDTGSLAKEDARNRAPHLTLTEQAGLMEQADFRSYFGAFTKTRKS